MDIFITVPTSKNTSVGIELRLPVSIPLDTIHDNISHYVSGVACLSCEDAAFQDLDVKLDGCVTTENYLNVFSVAVGNDDAIISFS